MNGLTVPEGPTQSGAPQASEKSQQGKGKGKGGKGCAPLPPPPGGRVIPPVPPPQMGKVPKISGMDPSTAVQNEKAIFGRKLHWIKPGYNDPANETLFQKLAEKTQDPELQIDSQILTAMFTDASSKACPKSARGQTMGMTQGRSSGIALLESKRAQNMAIVFGQFKATTEEVCEQLRNNDFSEPLLNTDQVELVLGALPTPEEVKQLSVFAAKPEMLRDVERKVLPFCQVSHCDVRLRLLRSSMSHKSHYESIKLQLSDVQLASKQLMESKLMHKLFAAVLQSGNQVNGGSAVKSFAVETLSSICTFKIGETTLIHFLCITLHKSDPNFLQNLLTELPSLKSAARTNLHGLQELVDSFCREAKSVERDVHIIKDDAVHAGTNVKPSQERRLGNLVAQVQEEALELEESMKHIHQVQTSAQQYFGGVGKLPSSEVFFGYFVDFLTTFTSAWQEISKNPQKWRRYFDENMDLFEKPPSPNKASSDRGHIASGQNRRNSATQPSLRMPAATEQTPPPFNAGTPKWRWTNSTTESPAATTSQKPRVTKRQPTQQSTKPCKASKDGICAPKRHPAELCFPESPAATITHEPGETQQSAPPCKSRNDDMVVPKLQLPSWESVKESPHLSTREMCPPEELQGSAKESPSDDDMQIPDTMPMTCAQTEPVAKFIRQEKLPTCETSEPYAANSPSGVRSASVSLWGFAQGSPRLSTREINNNKPSHSRPQPNIFEKILGIPGSSQPGTQPTLFDKIRAQSPTVFGAVKRSTRDANESNQPTVFEKIGGFIRERSPSSLWRSPRVSPKTEPTAAESPSGCQSPSVNLFGSAMTSPRLQTRAEAPVGFQSSSVNLFGSAMGSPRLPTRNIMEMNASQADRSNLKKVGVPKVLPQWQTSKSSPMVGILKASPPDEFSTMERDDQAADDVIQNLQDRDSSDGADPILDCDSSDKRYSPILECDSSDKWCSPILDCDSSTSKISSKSQAAQLSASPSNFSNQKLRSGYSGPGLSLWSSGVSL